MKENNIIPGKRPVPPTPWLDKIQSLEDLRKMKVEDLPNLCQDLRTTIIHTLADHPGHFASSMGAIEIIVALHYVFNTPDDRIVWDVGHQAYAHKILTGRKDDFHKIRTSEGPSGFPNPKESPFDTFIAGHAGNSISAALGMAIADQTTPGGENRKTVALIGDASISNGLAFEGLNNASNNPNNLLIILNDNEMSIDNNVGALHRYLSDITTTPGYNRVRFNAYNFFKRHGLITDNKKGRLQRFFNSLKAFISEQQNIFEGLNIRYFGPFDGHDVVKLVKIFRDIKDMQGPRLLHLHTVKGKGYQVAEEDPAVWHAPGEFDPLTGERKKSSKPKPPKWQDVFGKTLVELADAHPEVVGITAAMPSGTSVNLMLDKYPDRTYDVGISEGHAVTFAGGLAAAGKHPFVAIYSSFLQRAYDNIIHDVAIQGLPVTFCIDRAGIVGEDGVTHHGMFDLAYLRIIPGMVVASPMDEASLRNLMYSSLKYNGPFAIRYPRGNAVHQEWQSPFSKLEIGKGRELQHKEGNRIGVISFGPIGNDVTSAIEELKKEGLEVSHYDLLFLKPLDNELIKKAMDRHDTLVIVEDGISCGGVYSAILEWKNAASAKNRIVPIGAPDKWIHHGKVNELRHECGYSVEDIQAAIRQEMALLTSKVKE